MNTTNLTYHLSIRLTGEELDALACMARTECRDIKMQAIFNLRRAMMEYGYLPFNPAPQRDPILAGMQP